MIVLKTAPQIDKMRVAGKILASVLDRLTEMIAPGITTACLDAEADRMIREAGGEATFRGQPGLTSDAPPYPAATCISINEQVIHGIPSARVIREGDLVSIDCGVTWHGFIADSAVTVAAGRAADRARELMETTRESLEIAISLAVPGSRLHDLSAAIHRHATLAGFGIVRDYCGHGVGAHLHEDPPIPNYGNPGTGPMLRPGMTLAVEPMVTLGNPRIRVLGDGWTVITADHKPAAHFEHTLLVTDGPAEVLTRRESERATAV